VSAGAKWWPAHREHIADAIEHAFGPGSIQADAATFVRSLKPPKAPSTKASRFRSQARATKAAKRETKNAETAALREEAFRRAEWRCECGCRFPVRENTPGAGELDHFFSRRHGQSLEVVWVLAQACHRAKTDNRPSRATWLRLFITHCKRHGYAAARGRAERDLETEETKAALDSGRRSNTTQEGEANG
jgi:5-methylcytosine-specific restriction endonuclease McrA